MYTLYLQCFVFACFLFLQVLFSVISLVDCSTLIFSVNLIKKNFVLMNKFHVPVKLSSVQVTQMHCLSSLTVFVLTVVICSCRTPVFTEEVTVGENGEVEVLPPERSFWAKYVSMISI